MLIDSFFARQPIFDKDRRVRAYEILYRSGPTARTAEVLDGAEATAEVLASAFGGLAPDDLLGGLPGYVNLPREMIVNRSLLAFEPDRVAAEILEDVVADPEVLDALVEMRGLGYRVALDDFTPEPSRMRLLKIADIVKIDVMALSQEELRRTATLVSRYDVTMLAEKVETIEEFELCTELGFELFQGYFFAKPELMAAHRLDEGRGRLVELMTELHAEEPSIDRVVRSVEAHPNIAFQVLRVLNSTASGLPRRVQSIREGVIMLGLRRVTELASVLILAAHDHKPRELLALGLGRARMCELIARRAGLEDPASFFTVGVFSVLDALADRPLVEIVRALPLSDEVAMALVERTGPKGEVLAAAIAYERGEWDTLPAFGVDARSMSADYIDSLDWAGSMLAMVA